MGLNQVSVAGFKSISEEQTIDLGPLTILAGENSSGKSSFFQTLLLLKQTIESPHDPGPLLLHGPNVRFSDFSQLVPVAKPSASFRVKMCFLDRTYLDVTFGRSRSGINIRQQTIQRESPDGQTGRLRISPNSKRSVLTQRLRELERLPDFMSDSEVEVSVGRDRCFLRPEFSVSQMRSGYVSPKVILKKAPLPISFSPESWSNSLRSLIHVPGLRGTPERAYKFTGVGRTFPGRFDDYVASVISSWEGQETLGILNNQLNSMGLAGNISTEPIDDSSLRIVVGTGVSRHKQEMSVNIADVGFGVSQVLPVLAALLEARKNQTVYIEQPEIHLHPKAQLGLAKPLVRAAKRGVQVVVETHSPLLIRGIQAEIAAGQIPPSEVSLNWFTRSGEDAATRVSKASIEEDGSFGDWPQDFDDVSMLADLNYLEAATKKQQRGKG